MKEYLFSLSYNFGIFLPQFATIIPLLFSAMDIPASTIYLI